jgi:hemerythrin-like domain-containing protein
MMPVGPLMIEHRLIERVIKLMIIEIDKINSSVALDTDLLNAIIDFIKTYADHLHHGKEEDILFQKLSQKSLSSELAKIMDELIAEHKQAREYVKILQLASREYSNGKKDNSFTIINVLKSITEFYPKHMEKEDKHFFIPVMGYFTPDEQEAMLIEFQEFDRKFTQRHYLEIISKLDGKSNFPVK